MPPVTVDTKHPPDWATVWAMRWSAATAVFTGLSWVAIGLTALFALHAISATASIERSKLARDLLDQYRSRNIDAALQRFMRGTSGEYTREAYLGDLNTVITYYEECALYYEVKSVNRELLFRILDVKIVSTWHQLAPMLQGLSDPPEAAAKQFPGFRAFAVLAQTHLKRRKDITVPSELIAPLP